MTQFNETKKRYMEATGCTYPLTYEQWLRLNDKLKAAALFVNFYEQITLAWVKAKSEFTMAEDGVSTVMQYIMKNVPHIISDCRKYTPAYMYRVAYNCLGCLRRVQREQDRYAYTTSRYAIVDDEEIDLFNTIIEDEDILDNIYDRDRTKAFWDLIENMEQDTQSVIGHLLNGDRLKIKVEANKDKHIKDISNKLRKYKSMYYESKSDDSVRFNDVLRIDDEVASAVVEMHDGTMAVYYGETRVAPNGNTKVVFYGPNHDYVVPINIAKKLKVTDIELY